MTAEVRQKPLISVANAAELLGIGTTTAYDWLRAGALPGAVQVNGRWYVRRAVLEAYVRGDDVLGDAVGAPMPLGNANARPIGRAPGEGR